MEKFVLPEKWCCRATNQKEDIALTDYIVEQFGEACEYDPDVNGNCWFSNIKISAGELYHYTFNGKPNNCTEITYEQFLKYVLNQNIPKEQPEDNTELNQILIKLLTE